MVEMQSIPAAINEARLVETLSSIVDIASPTGEEAALAKHIVRHLSGFGINAETQHLNNGQVNAIGSIEGKGGEQAKNLLLYAPLDTVTTGQDFEDLPWIGPKLRPDMRAEARHTPGHIVGLGAHNPKGHAACIIEAACVLKEHGIALAGDVYLAFGASGMPTAGRPGMSDRPGHGAGCNHLLASQTGIDAAIVAKSGFAVTWEEVGFVWMDVVVKGTHTYVGSIHLLPYRGAISNAGKLIERLEVYFADRAEALATECVKPQAVVSFIEAGWERMPAFTPAECRFRIDVRFGPNQTAAETEADIRQVVRVLCDELKISADVELVQEIPASQTDFESDIIQTAIRTWELVKGKPHRPFREMSGSTDANIVRSYGIPTARMGLPKADLPDLDFQMGMNCVAVSDLRDLTAMLVMSAVSYCGQADRG
ncbi:MAG: M20/M25/M40 family metallo-hydrolase [Pseudomonadota bacterium]